ncbi:hypothetical protein HaLaN_12844, partial [Haematococcus lacustris]
MPPKRERKRPVSPAQSAAGAPVAVGSKIRSRGRGRL